MRAIARYHTGKQAVRTVVSTHVGWGQLRIIIPATAAVAAIVAAVAAIVVAAAAAVVSQGAGHWGWTSWSAEYE